MSTREEPLVASSLRCWLAGFGGNLYPEARFSEDDFGLRIVATQDIPEDTHIVSCPFSLVVTKEFAENAVLEILKLDSTVDTEEWTERQWICTYLSLHWIIGSNERLAHIRYLNTLPTAEKLRTPLHFSPAELDLFKGTNLYGATLDRERDWKVEWNQCRSVLTQANSAWGDLYTWEHYLTTATYLSSRAFPSSILSSTPSLAHSSSTQPILVPGVDAPNHASGHPVSWLVTHSNEAEDTQAPSGATITLVHHPSVSKGQELFNNYGPKPNSELILGYGFSLAHNPHDTIVLKVGGIKGGKWEIGRNSSGAEGLWKEILSSFVGPGADGPNYEDVLDASGMLQEMVQTLLDRLPVDDDLKDGRPDVIQMFQHYLEGQRDILQSLLGVAQAREQDAVEMAREQGIDLVLEE